MLYLARYEIDLEHVETAMAKRMEWDEVAPEGFEMVCEFAIHGQPPPFGGFMVFRTESAEDLNFLILYYGKTVRMDVRPCSNVLEAMSMTKKALSSSR